ncbi:hypothetical protein DP68_08765 [Clostridium sp. HMP27]|nr:hypothetical protein DP68_08765 [Clostridium sp. HMP27]
MQECIVCGNPYSEEHHIVFRGQQEAMINCPLNKKSLCCECHRGKNGPHLNRSIDLKYKIELQEEMYKLFSAKECYSEDEVKIILQIPRKHVRKLLKPLGLKVLDDTVGYCREDIIKQAMGGKFYGK